MKRKKNKFIVFGRNNKFEMYSYFNKSSNIVFQAGKSCYAGKTDNITYQDILKFIAARIKVGHESIIEHSNFILATKIPDKNLKDLIEILNCCKYLNTKSIPIKNKKEDSILVNIGGSIRGWKHIYRTIENLSNPILQYITKEIYKNIPKEYFLDFIEDGIFDESEFMYIDEEKDMVPKYNDNKLDYCIPNDLDNKIKLKNIDIVDDVLTRIPADFIISNSISDMLTITVRFNGLARYSTHQLVRHRNGITQSSMRYINFSDMTINNPMIYNKDYDKDKKYKLTSNEFIQYPEEGLTAEELCEALQPLYKDLKDGGMKPEEARGFTVQAINAGELYMTFTYRTLAKFLELRTDSHAQGEIREWANTLHEYISDIPEINYLFNNVDGTLSNSLLEPRYKSKLNDVSQIDELLDEINEEIDKLDNNLNTINEGIDNIEDELNKGLDSGNYQ